MQDKLESFSHTEVQPIADLVLDEVKVAEKVEGSSEVYDRIPSVIKNMWASCTVHESCLGE